MKFYFKPYFVVPIKFTFKDTSTRTAPPFFCSGMPASSPDWLGQEFMSLQSTHIRIQTFWDNLNYYQVILFQIFDKLPAPLEINPQKTAHFLVVCRRRYFFPYPFLDFEFFYLFLYFTLKIYQNLLFFSNEDVRRIEPQTNNHKSNYRTTRPARDELPDLRF